MDRIYTEFIADVTKQKHLRRLCNKNLADMTGYSLSTINLFLCQLNKSPHVAIALSHVLGISLPASVYKRRKYQKEFRGKGYASRF